MATVLVENYRLQFRNAHDWFEATIGKADDAMLHWAPPGIVTPIASHYAHAVIAEDFLLGGYVMGKTPVALQGILTGFSEPPPRDANWRDWGMRVKMDNDTARAYARRVYAATDAYLAALTDDFFAGPFDYSLIGGTGTGTRNDVVTLIQSHWFTHAGVVAAIKGLKEQKGFPF